MHIFFAIAWLGGSLYLSFVLGPRSATLSPSAAMEFFARVGRPTIRYLSIVGSLTIVFGLILLYVYFGSDYATWPLSLDLGFTLGLVAFLDGLLFTAPAASKAADIANNFVGKVQPGPPPPEFLAATKEVAFSSVIGTMLLIITAVFMVSTAFY